MSSSGNSVFMCICVHHSSDGTVLSLPRLWQFFSKSCSEKGVQDGVLWVPPFYKLLFTAIVSSHIPAHCACGSRSFQLVTCPVENRPSQQNPGSTLSLTHLSVSLPAWGPLCHSCQQVSHCGLTHPSEVVIRSGAEEQDLRSHSTCYQQSPFLGTSFSFSGTEGGTIISRNRRKKLSVKVCLLVIICTIQMDHVNDSSPSSVFQVICAVYIETELAGNF